MRLSFKLGGIRIGYTLAIALAYLGTHICVRCEDSAALGNPWDPAIGEIQMDDLSIVPVPSVRAALASNPSISDNLLIRLAQDNYDSVHLAALTAWKARYPKGNDARVSQFDAGKKLASPDYVELRDLIFHDQALQAALAWRSLPLELKSNLV